MPRGKYNVVESKHTGQAKCKRCKEKITKGSLRLGVPYAGVHGPSTAWRHLACCREDEEEQGEFSFYGVPHLPKSLSSLNGWDELADDEQREIEAHFAQCWQSSKVATTTKAKAKKAPAKTAKKRKRGDATDAIAASPIGQPPLVVD